jgi:hypothetical protein
MRARNVLVAPVITGKKAAELCLGKRISAAPVVDGEQRLVALSAHATSCTVWRPAPMLNVTVNAGVVGL